MSEFLLTVKDELKVKFILQLLKELKYIKVERIHGQSNSQKAVGQES